MLELLGGVSRLQTEQRLEAVGQVRRCDLHLVDGARIRFSSKREKYSLFKPASTPSRVVAVKGGGLPALTCYVSK